MERNTSGYVFDGVLEDGSENNIEVDFANPANPLSENRWVRYGPSGVTEESIVDASWIKLSDITLSYSFKNKPVNIFNIRFSGEVSLFARNLFVVSEYKGFYPESTLFNYGVPSGIHLFNTPPVRTFGTSLLITFN